MSRSPIVTIIAATIVMTGATAPLFAQTAFWRHEVTGVVGGQLSDVSGQYDDFGANFQKEMNLGGRYQYNITPRWALEGSFLYTPVNAELARLSRDVSVDSSYYSGNVVFNILPNHRFVPYATGGIGGVTLDVQSGGETETYLGFNFGGGITAPISDRWSFRVDVRDFVYTADNLNPASVGALEVPASFDETIHDVSIDFGITFGF